MNRTERTDPPLAGTEAETLVGFLDFHRNTLRVKTEELSAAQLDQRLAPSTLTLGGLLKHMAYVEDWWFNQVLAGHPEPEPWASVDWKADGDWEFHSAAQDTPEQLRALLDETIAVSDRILHDVLAAEGLDAVAKRVSRRDPDRRLSLRWIVVHMIEEYARHNGHADLILHDVLAAEGLDAVAKRVSRRDPDRRLSLRWIVVHMIEEYARHNGHADLIRESVDGQVGE